MRVSHHLPVHLQLKAYRAGIHRNWCQRHDEVGIVRAFGKERFPQQEGPLELPEAGNRRGPGGKRLVAPAPAAP